MTTDKRVEELVENARIFVDPSGGSATDRRKRADAAWEREMGEAADVADMLKRADIANKINAKHAKARDEIELERVRVLDEETEREDEAEEEREAAVWDDEPWDEEAEIWESTPKRKLKRKAGHER